MTDRVDALTVVLDHDIRTDDIEPLINAISQLRGVLRVEPHVGDPTAAYVEGIRIRTGVVEDLRNLMREWMK